MPRPRPSALSSTLFLGPSTWKKDSKYRRPLTCPFLEKVASLAVQQRGHRSCSCLEGCGTNPVSLARKLRCIMHASMVACMVLRATGPFCMRSTNDPWAGNQKRSLDCLCFRSPFWRSCKPNPRPESLDRRFNNMRKRPSARRTIGNVSCA